MNSDRMNKWLTLGANMGVLLGIILLVIELNQNRDMMRAQIRNEMATEIIGMLSDIAYSPEFASVFNRGVAGEELTPDEATQFQMRAFALFRYFENVHYQYRQGLYDESEFATQKIAWTNALSSKRVSRLWCGYRNSISVEAREAIDELLSDRECD